MLRLFYIPILFMMMACSQPKFVERQGAIENIYTPQPSEQCATAVGDNKPDWCPDAS